MALNSSPISSLRLLLPFLLLLRLAASIRICVDQDWVPGTCVITVTWSQFETSTFNHHDDRESTIYDDLYGTIIDGNGTQLTDTWTPGYQRCNGAADNQCIVNSKLPDPVRLSPQQQHDYLQFYFQDQAWHTRTDLPADQRNYVTDKETFPYCELAEWVERPKDEKGRYLPPFNAENMLHAKSRDIKCQFDCRTLYYKG
ncbi:hypothetical protein TWF696_007549 [Orbilia brochopaga]|uniref:Uncharacterized protein n=1 Tax=Orbilia brochopaga TaxID=3140254 RepID=A0AAV9ULE2_9PEZI